MSEQESKPEQNKENDESNKVPVSGILELSNNKTGQLLQPERNGKARSTDPFISKELIRRFKLKTGNFIEGIALQDDRFRNPKVRFIEKIDGLTVEERKRKFRFQELTTLTPDEQLRLETKDGRMTNRVMDLFCPIGKGQRGLIVAPPRTGKTTLLHDIAAGVLENNPEVHVMVLLVDERPEEVTDFKRSVPAEVFASSNDEPIESHLRISEIAIERAKRLT
ncbi:MAG: transcription termination factor Rho, partial [Opitutales bacterium]|nr:transcription termination factor Rho [Opitutales bacterium]